MRIILFILVLAGLIYGFIYLNNQGSFHTYNQYINDLIKNKPKKICSSDSECHIIAPDCDPCTCGIVANVRWQPYCPFKNPSGIVCSPCPQINKNQIKCLDTVCQISSEGSWTGQ